MNIVVTDADTLVGDGVTLDCLHALGDVTVYGMTLPEELPARIADADIVLCNKVAMTAEAMAAAPNLKYVGLFATGYNNVDLAYAREHGITVCNVPDYSTDAVAQHTFAFILAHYNHVADYNATVEATIFFCAPVQGAEETRPYTRIEGRGRLMKAICDRISDVVFVNTFNCGICGIFEKAHTNGRDLLDGLHPNVNGAKKIGEYNARALKRHTL